MHHSAVPDAALFSCAVHPPSSDDATLAAFPDVLRALIADELAAGNAIVDVGGGFPAPPVGACVKLAKAVTTHPRESRDGLDFYDRNSSLYAGEFTDAKRFYFVLEPPRPPEPEPDMDAIRDAIQARQRAADAARFSDEAVARQAASAGDDYSMLPERQLVARRAPVAGSASPRVDRFRESMVMTYDRWHDGAGYEVALVTDATAAEREEIERVLLAHGIDDWRDVEALAALATLGSAGAQRALRTALDSPTPRVRIAVVEYAPALLTDAERSATLVKALETTDTYGGLTQALLLVEDFHPPAVIDALLRGVLQRGANAVHFAAMLMYVHGQAQSSFDWEQRPFFLRFNTSDADARATAFRELCARIGVAPEPYLEAYRAS